MRMRAPELCARDMLPLSIGTNTLTRSFLKIQARTLYGLFGTQNVRNIGIRKNNRAYNLNSKCADLSIVVFKVA
jgi:hypothetical protein